MMGTSAFGQTRSTANVPTCASNPVPVAKAYVGYNGLTNETAAMYSWCKNETMTNIQNYCNSVANSMENVANYGNLSDGCKAEYVRRKQELEVIQKLTQSRH